MNKNLFARLRPLIGLLVLSIAISWFSPRFLTTGNILNVLRQP